MKQFLDKVKGHPDIKEGTAYMILFSIGFCHLLNDMIQSVIPAMYPLLKDNFGFTFAQIGIITLVFQLTSSVLQPFVGRYADSHPQPTSFIHRNVLHASRIALVGRGFRFRGHPVGRGRHRLRLLGVPPRSLACGADGFWRQEKPGAIHIPSGRERRKCHRAAACRTHPHPLRPARRGMVRRSRTARRHAARKDRILVQPEAKPDAVVRPHKPYHILQLAGNHRAQGIGHPGRHDFLEILFISCMTSYFTFFLIEKFGITVQESQFSLFAFLAALAVGTLLGGFLGDRYGRKYVILFSILGAAPFTLALPYLNLYWTIAMAIIVGLVIASAFSAILVYATDLKPDKVGMISGLFFGLMFGLGGIGSAFFGWLADRTSIEFIFRTSTLLPLLGIIATFLPNIRPANHK